LGVLGATAYIARKYYFHMATNSYTLNSNRRNGMRRSLGGLLGFISGIFLAEQIPEMKIVNLPLIIISFLMGYSVEFAFAFFDAFTEYGRKAVDSLSQPLQKQRN
jgi:hypothetical protein